MNPAAGCPRGRMARLGVIRHFETIGGLGLEGVASPHDRVGGRRFGNATLWRWQQGGLTAGDRVLLDNPDVLIIGVGGGSKI